jgi:drug/metabolite transporter (DMT)-like permease
MCCLLALVWSGACTACRQGKVTDAMLATPKPLFLLTGSPNTLSFPVALPHTIYCIVLCRQGKVTDAMLDTPKPLFVLTGMCEAAAQLLMMTGAAHLPGALLPLLMQTVLLWNLLFSRMVFGTR